MELYVNWHTWQRTEPELRGLLPAQDADAVASAVEFAVRYHGDQTRPTGAPYAEHLLEALEFLVRGPRPTTRSWSSWPTGRPTSRRCATSACPSSASTTRRPSATSCRWPLSGNGGPTGTQAGSGLIGIWHSRSFGL